MTKGASVPRVRKQVKPTTTPAELDRVMAAAAITWEVGEERRIQDELRPIEQRVGDCRERGVDASPDDLKRLGELYTAYHRQRGVTHKARERARK